VFVFEIFEIQPAIKNRGVPDVVFSTGSNIDPSLQVAELQESRIPISGSGKPEL